MWRSISRRSNRSPDFFESTGSSGTSPDTTRASEGEKEDEKKGQFTRKIATRKRNKPPGSWMEERRERRRTYSHRSWRCRARVSSPSRGRMGGGWRWGFGNTRRGESRGRWRLRLWMLITREPRFSVSKARCRLIGLGSHTHTMIKYTIFLPIYYSGATCYDVWNVVRLTLEIKESYFLRTKNS